MKICITGSDGFIAKNIISRLSYKKKYKIFFINKKTKPNDFVKILKLSNVIIHLAGVNRAGHQSEYDNNYKFTKSICDTLSKLKKKPKIIFASTVQATKKNAYGISKKKAETILKQFYYKNKNKLFILRLPNIFGKWSKPNYNSFIATLCYSKSRKKRLSIFGLKKKIKLMYIDDLVDQIIDLISFNKNNNKFYYKLNKVYTSNIARLNSIVSSFKLNREKLYVNDFSDDFTKKLYSTYLSFLPEKNFTYKLKKNFDKRGDFVEFLKSKNFGQVSYFSINKNQKRGGHFHHTKVEKFLLLDGKIKFTMQKIDENKKINFILDDHDKVIESIPGYSHTLQNIGNKIAKLLVWSNEIYDKKKPDTYTYNI